MKNKNLTCKIFKLCRNHGTNNFIEYENAPKISLELHKKLKRYQTKKGDVLLTIVGNSVGDVGLVNFELEKCNLTENVTKITDLKGLNGFVV